MTHGLVGTSTTCCPGCPSGSRASSPARARIRCAADCRSWDDLLVIGDIYELGLALPLELGAQVILVDNGTVVSWERSYLASHPNARIITNIATIPTLVP
mgnify:CR=1 FL=1